MLIMQERRDAKVRLTRQQIKEKLSDRGRKGAEARWREYHASIPQPDYHELPPDCFRITVDNLVSGKTHVLLFHPGSRRGRFQIDVNGAFWRECGFSDALARIRKSCKRTPLYVQ